MTSGTCDLVHFNLAMARYPLDHPGMEGFTRQLTEVNKLAEGSPGFLWTPAGDEAGDAVAAFGSPLVLANISTWRSLEDLRRFVYDGLHGSALRRRREWFDPLPGPPYVLWWSPAGSRPNWSEAKTRREHFMMNGPTPMAFTFSDPFNSSGEPPQSLIPNPDRCL